MIEYAQWIGTFLSLFNVFLAFIDKKIYKLFKNRAATDPSTGISIDSLSSLFRWRLRRMRNSGFILDTETKRYYFNEGIHKARRKTRRFRLIILLVIVLIIGLSIIFVRK